MVRRIRPDWSKEDIILQRFTVPDTINRSILYGGYTTSKAEMVLIKVYEPEDASQKRLVRFCWLLPKMLYRDKQRTSKIKITQAPKTFSYFAK
jgi:hypothetical protein